MFKTHKNPESFKEKIECNRNKRAFSYIGKRYGKLIIVSYLGYKKQNMIFLCKCDCGNEKEIILGSLKGGHTKSCGCIRKSNGEIFRKHGLSKHPLYSIWNGIYERCYNSNHPAYKRYGGCGVTMSEDWRNNFISFYNWAINNGWVKGLDIDKDKNGGTIYSAEKCVILNRKQNNRLRKGTYCVEYKGEIKPFSEWCDLLGLKYSTTLARIKRHQMSVDDAFNFKRYYNQSSKPKGGAYKGAKSVICINDNKKYGSMGQAAHYYGIKRSHISESIYKPMLRKHAGKGLNFKFI